MNAKIKEELSNKELEGCTFKPKINSGYHAGRDGVEIEDRSGRLNKLYKLGIQIVSAKKDRPRDELEIEQNGTECTFKPNTQKSNEIPIKEDPKIQNDIYNEKSYELHYNRLKNGRLERQIRESVHERGEFPAELLDHSMIIYNHSI
jgi:hypothetical protein